MKDFTDTDRPTEPIRFTVDGDTFECAAVLPAGAGYDLVAAATSGDKGQMVALAGASLDAIMLPESARRFAQRMRDPERPITDAQVGAILRWLTEQYSARPTTPASSS